MSSIASSTKNPTFNGNPAFSSYLCPPIFQGQYLIPREEIDKRILGWLVEAIQEGERFIKQQPIYGDLDRAIDLIIGKVGEKYPKPMSNVNVNLLKKAIREDVATLSNLRPSWIYESNSSEDPTWITQASILNKCNANWYQATFVRESIKSWLQYGFAHGIGYLSPVWVPDYHEPGIGDIELKPYHYKQVYHVGMNSDYNIQRSYATIIKETYDIRTVWDMFPSQAYKIFPNIAGSRESDGMLARAKASLVDLVKGSASDPKPTQVDLYYCYIKDHSCNPLPTSFKMGKGSWEYQVPAVGEEVFDKYTQLGERKTKLADKRDTYLYPNRRLIICTKEAVLYDNTSFYWHGKVPLVDFCPDKWIFGYIGQSLALQLEPANNSFNSMIRGMEDGLMLTLDPPGAVDDTLTAKSTAEKSFRVAGRKIRSRLNMGEIFKPFMPAGAYTPAPAHYSFTEKLESWIEDIAGAPSLKALDQARQIPTSDTVEKFFSVSGSVTTDMSQSMDKPIWQIADQNRYNFFQFYDKQRRMFLLGETGQTKEDYDPDAGTMVPNIVKDLQVPRRDHSILVPYDYDPETLIPISFPNEPQPVLSDRTMRAKWHIRNFTTTIQPKSLHEITNIQRKLLLIQASKIMPIDPQTLAEVLDIPNFGKLKGDTVLERYQSWMKLQEKMGLSQQFHQFLLQLGMQMLAQSVQPQSPEQQVAGGMEQLAGALKGGASPQGGGGQEGRPPSFNEAPKMTQRSDGRTTIETS